MSKRENYKRNANNAGDKITMEEEHDFRFLKAPKSGENHVEKHPNITDHKESEKRFLRAPKAGTNHAISAQAEPARPAAISLRSDTTKNSFKALGLYLSNIDDDFDSYISNNTETKKANGINEIITNNNINYCIRFKDCQTTNATNSVYAASSNLKATTIVQRQLPLSIKSAMVDQHIYV